jgi:hypothetical protein
MRENKAWLLAITALVLLSITGCNILKSSSPSSPDISQIDTPAITTTSPETSTSAAIITGTPSAITPTITGSVTSTPEIKTIVIDKPVPATYTTYTDPNGLFTISYPADWEIPQENKQQIAEVSSQVYQFLNGTIESQFTGGPLFTARKQQPFAVINLGFSVHDLHPTPGYSNENLSIYKTTADSHNAILVECDGWDPDAGKFRVLSMKIILYQNSWQIQCSARPEDYAKWENDFRTIAGSLRILK